MDKTSRKKPSRKSTYIWCGITLLWIFVIWGHSLMSGSLSSMESNRVLAFLQPIFTKLGLSDLLALVNIRKVAHFTEFFILGIFLSISIRKYFVKWPIPVHFCAMLTGAFIAICDESIQAFIPGRASQITDVVIDFSGVFCAVLIFMLVKYISYILSKKQKKKSV